MAKSISVMVVVLVVALTAYLGMSWYRTVTNTPERVMAGFATDLAKAESEPTYERLTSDLKRRYSEQAWKDYLKTFQKSSPQPTLISQEEVKDTFNAYPANSNPQRFTYSFKVEERDYLTTAILYKQGNSWLVDEFQGDYR